MKKLTPQERDLMRTKPAGRTSLARIHIHNMKPGEIILLEPMEWKQKKSPAQMIKRIVGKGSKQFTLVKSLDQPGWIVERLK